MARSTASSSPKECPSDSAAAHAPSPAACAAAFRSRSSTRASEPLSRIPRSVTALSTAPRNAPALPSHLPRQARVRGSDLACAWWAEFAPGFSEPELGPRQFRWRRRESNPRPRSHEESVYKRIPGFRFARMAAPGQATPRASPSLMSRSAAEAFPLPASPLNDAGGPSRGLEGPARCLVPRRRVRDQIPHLRFPGILRGHLEPRLATLPESQPCRNQVAPEVMCRLPWYRIC